MRIGGYVLPAWFAAAVVLTTATELRFGGGPVGPGEILLVGWLAVIMARMAWTGGFVLPPVARAVGLFWFVSFVALVAGNLFSTSLGVQLRPGTVAREFLAFAFSAVVILVYLAQPRLHETTVRTMRLVLLFTVVPLSLLYLYGLWISPTVGAIQIWYGNRFGGFSKNPNQLALLLCTVPFVAYHFLRESTQWKTKLWYGSLMVGSLIVGMATLSDALVVSWAAGLGMVLCLVWYHAATQRGRDETRAAFVFILVPLAVMAAAVLRGPSLLRRVTEYSNEIYAYGNQGSARLTLWNNGIAAFSESPLFGLGPGAFSGITLPFEGSEAHNTFVDWAASTGLLGLSAYVGLMGWLMLRAWRNRHPVLFVAVAAAVAFSVFHYVLRHPIFWTYMVSIGVLAGGAPAARSRVAAPAPRRHSHAPAGRARRGVPAPAPFLRK